MDFIILKSLKEKKAIFSSNLLFEFFSFL